MVTTKHLGQKLSRKQPPAVRSSHSANGEGASNADLAKTVIFRADKTFYLCVVPVACHIDMELLSWLLGVDDIHVATDEEITELLADCQSDATACLEKILGLPSIFDKKIRATTVMIVQPLPDSTAVQVNLADFERTTSPQVLDFCD